MSMPTPTSHTNFAPLGKMCNFTLALHPVPRMSPSSHSTYMLAGNCHGQNQARVDLLREEATQRGRPVSEERPTELAHYLIGQEVHQRVQTKGTSTGEQEVWVAPTSTTHQPLGTRG